MQLDPRSLFRPKALLFAVPLVAGTLLAGALIASAPRQAATTPAVTPTEGPFWTENAAAMAKMMVAMAVPPSGDVDADFVATMIPHHQGAIDMAQAELRYGQNVQLRRLAQEIIVTQQQEIAVMRLAIGRPIPAQVPSSSGPSSATAADAPPESHESMHRDKEH